MQSVSDGSLATTGSTWSFTTGTNYTLTTTDDGNGTVTFAPTGGTYLSGTTVTLTPTPDAGYVFSSWSGINASDIVNTGGVYTIVMNGNKSVTANFAPIQYTLNVTNEGIGSVTLNPTGGAYPSGTTVTLTPVPGTGYQFNSWSGTDAGDIHDNSGIFTILMDENKTIIANFIQIQYTLSISTEGNGSVAKNPDKATYTYGETVELTAIPGTGYTFAAWSGDLISTTSPVTITMTGNKSFTASFAAMNNAPVITEGESVAVTCDEDNTPVAFSLTLNATDPDGDVITWSVSTPASHGAATASGTGTSQAISYTPSANYKGSDSFVITVSDGNGGTDNITINVTVDQVNDAPVFTSTPVTTATEGAAYSYTAVATDVDDGDVLTFSAPALPSWLAFDAGTRLLSGTPLNENVGTHAVTLRVSDGHVTVDQSFNIIVGNINNAPVLGAIGDRSVNELNELAFTAMATDMDLPANTLSFSLVGAPVGAGITTDGFFTWTPSESQGPGSYNITVRVCDNGSPSLCDEEEITVTVNEVTYNLTISGNPVLSGTTIPEGGVHTYASGTVVNIIATPAAGYVFVNWSGDVAQSNSASTTVTMNGNKIITANFTHVDHHSGNNTVTGLEYLLVKHNAV